jgi:hypothetical protein
VLLWQLFSSPPSSDVLIRRLSAWGKELQDGGSTCSGRSGVSRLEFIRVATEAKEKYPGDIAVQWCFLAIPYVEQNSLLGVHLQQEPGMLMYLKKLGNSCACKEEEVVVFGYLIHLRRRIEIMERNQVTYRLSNTSNRCLAAAYVVQ